MEKKEVQVEKKEVQEALLEKLSSIERNTRNISKSLYVLARLNLMKYKNEKEVDITTDVLYLDLGEVLLTIEDDIFK